MARQVSLKISEPAHRKLAALQVIEKNVMGRQVTMTEVIEHLLELWETVNERRLDEVTR